MTEEVLKVGEPAPDFALKDDHGCVRTLKDFQGRKLILYFYPEDETPGCTIEAQGFRDHLEDFARAGWQVVGVSNDDVAALLIDENGRLLKVMRGGVAREHVAELLQMLCSK